MSIEHTNNFPKLHNAMWPGLVGKGSPGAEPSINLDTMLDLTAAADVDGVKFDGVDLFLFEPHVSIEIDNDGLKRLAEKVGSKGFVVGSVVAPVWPPTGGGSAMGSDEDRQRFLGQVRKACRIAQKLRELGARPYGVVRIDSACSPGDWSHDPEGNQSKIAQTFTEACEVAQGFGERLAAEGEICWGGMHSWKRMVDLLERVNRPATLGFQADMAHTLLYVLGYNAPEDAILPADWDWSDPSGLNDALATLTEKLRPWTIDFHVAQNDATVHGSGTHDKTGHHCLPNDPDGKLDIAHHAGFWLRDESGQSTRAFRHICWDGCMFPNAKMMQPETWDSILAAMISVRDAHGWREEEPGAQTAVSALVVEEIVTPEPRARRPAARKPVKPRKPKAARKAAKPVRRKAAPKRVRAKARPKRKARKSQAKKKATRKPRKIMKPRARKRAGRRR
ncbi:MAG: xylose isomerase [Verrucomicrobia bacterium]|nr:MAG: xylose isomerase [Verrucomicrobiota bacterium]